jgi:hypothetical protein
LDGLYGIVDSESDAELAYDKMLDSQIKNFLSKHHPVCTILLCSCMYLFSWLPWFGLVSYTLTASWIVQILCSFLLSTWLCFLFCNLRQLRRYLPHSVDELKEKIHDTDWWLWLCSRVFGCYDISSAKSSLLWLLGAVWTCWPFRYFLFSGHHCCSTTSTAHTWVVNNAAYLSVLCIVMYTFYAVVIILPSLVELQPQDSVFKRILAKLLLSFRPVLTWAGKSTSVALLIVAAALHSVFAIGRLLWFLWQGQLTWYAWLVSWMFVHMHIALSITALQAVSVLLWQNNVEHLCKEHFVSQYIAALNDSQPAEMDKLRAEVDSTFSSCLFKSTVYCLFMDVALDTDQEGLPADLVGNKVYKVFQAILQLELNSSESTANTENEEKQD